MSERPAFPIWFRRHSFNGDFAATPPKWHRFEYTDQMPEEWGIAHALCGYTQSNLLGRLQLSKSPTRPKSASLCTKCARKMQSATSVS